MIDIQIHRIAIHVAPAAGNRAFMTFLTASAPCADKSVERARPLVVADFEACCDCNIAPHSHQYIMSQRPDKEKGMIIRSRARAWALTKVLARAVQSLSSCNDVRVMLVSCPVAVPWCGMGWAVTNGRMPRTYREIRLPFLRTARRCPELTLRRTCRA